MKKILFVFVVSWVTGTDQILLVPCVGKEPPGIVCAKVSYKRAEQPFKSEEAAEAFEAVMKANKAVDVRLEKRPK